MRVCTCLFIVLENENIKKDILVKLFLFLRIYNDTMQVTVVSPLSKED